MPVRADKRPLGEWTGSQQSITLPDALARQFDSSAAAGHAVITGEVSGGLLSIDFDLDKKGEAKVPFDLERDFVDPWLEAISSVVEVATLPRQRTGSGGVQFFVRCPNPSSNVKLARVPANNRQGFHTVIETRGQSGYALLPPSQHPSGNLYAWQHLELIDVPMLTQEQVNALLQAARALDQMPLGDVEQKHLAESYQRRCSEQDEIIKTFNAKYHPVEILERNGYRLVRGKYLSPDSTSGNPGVAVFQNTPLIYSHHADALGDGRAHDAFDVFAYLEYGGDKKAAYEAAGRELGLWRDGSLVVSLRSSPMSEVLPADVEEVEGWSPRQSLAGLYPLVPALPPELIPQPLHPWLSDIAERASLPLEFVACPALSGTERGNRPKGRYISETPRRLASGP